MLNEELKNKLKAKYPKLYVTELDNGQQVVWHPLTRHEYREVVSTVDENKTDTEIIMNRQEDTCRRCIVYPEGDALEKLIQESAGVATTICDEIYAKSGFNMTKTSQEL
jgi:hypothetical protein